MLVCVCVCVCAVVGVSSASFNMVFISNEFLIRKMVFDACYNHRPTRRRRPGSRLHTHTKNKTTREDQQMDRVLTLRRLRRPSSVRRRRWHRSRVWQPRQVPPRARGTPRSPAVRSWSPARKKKKKSVGDECNSSVVIGWGRVDEIESVKTMLRENPLSPLSLSLRGGGLFFTRGSVNIAK